MLDVGWFAMLRFRSDFVVNPRPLTHFGRPGSLSLGALGTAPAGSKCIVSRTHVFPLQMSRIAFSLTPNDLANAAAVERFLGVRTKLVQFDGEYLDGLLQCEYCAVLTRLDEGGTTSSRHRPNNDIICLLQFPC
jgi:hypothetical protein